MLKYVILWVLLVLSLFALSILCAMLKLDDLSDVIGCSGLITLVFGGLGFGLLSADSP